MDYRNHFAGMHPLLKMLMLLLLAMLSLMLVSVVGLLAALPFLGDQLLPFLRGEAGAVGADNLVFSRYMQVLSHLGLFIVPALVFSKLVSPRPFTYLRLTERPLARSLVVGALLMVAALPMVHLLMQWNMELRLPGFLEGVEAWMRRTEAAAEQITALFLQTETWQGLAFNLFMIAIIPALGEEMIFRGVLLRILDEWTGRVHLAVWISAMLFSAMHMQFFSFLPRLGLGLVLGYMFVWSGKLWIPVFAHFFNNAAAVLLYHLNHNGYISYDLEAMGAQAVAWPWLLGGLLALLFLFVLYRRLENGGKQSSGPFRRQVLDQDVGS